MSTRICLIALFSLLLGVLGKTKTHIKIWNTGTHIKKYSAQEECIGSKTDKLLMQCIYNSVMALGGCILEQPLPANMTDRVIPCLGTLGCKLITCFTTNYNSTTSNSTI